jgi:spindle assembly abnormal protein 6
MGSVGQRLRCFFSQSSGGTTSRQRLLVIEVADEADPYFHHALAVGEAEFTDLKVEQAILVEFAAFPAHFVELLNCCRALPGGLGSPAQTRTSAASTPMTPSSGSFGLQLTIRDAAISSLSVVETNAFKHLAHLSLALRASNDAGLKRYLAARLQHTQATLRRSMEAGSAATGALERSRAAHESAAAELSALRSEASSRDAGLRAAHAAELSALREAHTVQLAAAESAARQAAAVIEAKHAEVESALRARAEEAATALLGSERAKAAVEVRARVSNKCALVHCY